MPGPSTHILIAEEITKKLEGMEEWPFQIAGVSTNENSPAEIHRILNANSHYAALGAIGPDLFYFVQDVRKHSKELLELLNFLDEAYGKLDDWFLSKWEKYMGPVSEDFEELISRLTGDLSSLVGDIVGSLGSIFTQLIINYIANSEDWWKFTSLGHNAGLDNKDFFWADMLHYRKTATYAHVLWQKAEEQTDPVWKDRLKAYALGYMTHVGTDTTGHAFINAKAGGSFRLHWQRHHLVESHVDTRTYFVKHGSDTLYNDFTKSAFHYRFAFKDDGSPARDRPSYDPGNDTLRGRYKRRRQLDLDSDIPEEVINLLLDAFKDVFVTQSQAERLSKNGTSPAILNTSDGRPGVDDVQTGFHILFRYYKHASLDGFAHEKPSPPDVFPNLDFPSMSDPLQDVAPDDNSDTNWLDIILSILALLEWLAEVALWLATVLPGAILDLATYGPRLLAYYLIELPLYYMVKAFRQVCIEAGYFRPMNDEIDDSMIKIGVEHNDYLSTLLSAMDDILVLPIDLIYDLESGSASNTYEVPDKMYPRSSPYDPKANEFSEYQHPYRYPLSPSENCVTYPGPFVRGTDAEYLVTDAIAANMGIINRLANCATPNDTVQFCYENVDAANNLGDPVNFSTFIIWQLARTGDENLDKNITEWNLDSDRGYGFKSWDWNRDPDNTDTDYEGHPFCVPCSILPQKYNSGDILGEGPNATYFNNGLPPLKLVYLDGSMQNEIGPCTMEIVCYNPNGNVIIL
ncbi:MAG TPA: zinc dependent phospholipase C family protein [Chitinophagaceae bacterium]|nr:zinc dependent phospholipase C family protein [Chitinophagaceae bacterium]